MPRSFFRHVDSPIGVPHRKKYVLFWSCAPKRSPHYRVGVRSPFIYPSALLGTDWGAADDKELDTRCVAFWVGIPAPVQVAFFRILPLFCAQQIAPDRRTSRAENLA